MIVGSNSPKCRPRTVIVGGWPLCAPLIVENEAITAAANRHAINSCSQQACDQQLQQLPNHTNNQVGQHARIKNCGPSYVNPILTVPTAFVSTVTTRNLSARLRAHCSSVTVVQETVQHTVSPITALAVWSSEPKLRPTIEKELGVVDGPFF